MRRIRPLTSDLMQIQHKGFEEYKMLSNISESC